MTGNVVVSRLLLAEFVSGQLIAFISRRLALPRCYYCHYCHRYSTASESLSEIGISGNR